MSTTNPTHTIHQEIEIAAPPARVYEALIDSAQHAEFTGAPAEISREAGGAFSCHGGAISGRNIELVENERIVQAWRVGNWDAGHYSVIRVQLEPSGEGTKLVLDHAGYPEGQGEHLAGGWHERYWGPLASYVARGS